jgi:site-specific recombinase XerD
MCTGCRYLDLHGHEHPERLAEEAANRFLTHLAVKEHVAASTQNQALAAILFLYQHVLQQPLDRIEGVVRAKRPRRLPVVLRTPLDLAKENGHTLTTRST